MANRPEEDEGGAPITEIAPAAPADAVVNNGMQPGGTAAEPAAVPVLQMQGMSKAFPGVVALDSVDLEVYAGEVLALIGENGAGKSTLMKILGGVYRPDAGTIRIDGQVVTIQSVSDAIRHGISFIHQELNVLDNLDVAANVFLGREPVIGGPLRLIDRGRIHRETRQYLDRLGLNVATTTPLRQLSLAEQQMVEIAKALSLNARILIMDEPTSSLTLTETERLLEVVKDLKNHGVTVIYISHRLGEIKVIADRVVGLRDGKNAGSLARSEISHDRMVRLMVGRDLERTYVHGTRSPGDNGLSIRDVRTRRYPNQAVSLEIRPGEILGLAGLVGAGRTELAEAIYGVAPALSGSILLDGQPVRIRSPRDAISRGIYLVPEDRRNSGLLVDLRIRENVTLPALKSFSVAGLINRGREEESASESCRALSVKAPSVEVPASSLSGGNQQKVVLAKWLSLQPRVLIFDEPTRGIDVGAKAEIYRLMRSLAENNVAILMISSDMEEVLGVSDRVAVMHEGSLTGILSREECSEEAIMHLAVGEAADTCAPLASK